MNTTTLVEIGIWETVKRSAKLVVCFVLGFGAVLSLFFF